VIDLLGLNPDGITDPTAFFRRLFSLLGGGERVALCTLLRLTGSGPRGPGAKMLVQAHGRSVGTVGGGALEARVTGWAGEVLRTGRAICRSICLDSTQAADAGMICGGEAEVLVESLDGAEPAQREFFRKILEHLVDRRRSWLATAILDTGDRILTGRLLLADGRVAADIPLPGHLHPEGLFTSTAPGIPCLVAQGAVRYFVEPLVPPDTVYIFGAGHIGERLVPLCRWLGFRTVVVDDRAEFASSEHFPQADELVVSPSLDSALDGLAIDRGCSLVIVTRGHAGDQTVLRQALRRPAGYIGMIGSRRKRDAVFQQLAGEGFTPADLARVACPIGLSIQAESPEEIALSIAAQLVAARAARRGEG
jgi:xanthine dehydrogenase accessory factor